VVTVIGDPVAHSRSPLIHNTAFAACGLDWVMVALPVAAGDAAAAVAGLRALGVRGASVTMPHKASVLDHLDAVDDVALRLGAVNCIRRDDDGRLVGTNTDGAGFLAGLRWDFDLDPAGARCVVLGAGGAARAVVLALAGAGAAQVVVVNRTPERGEAAARLAGAVGAVGGTDALRRADLVVNATPVGMAGTDGSSRATLPCDPGDLAAGTVVAELVYHPPVTPLIDAARSRGLRTSNGLSMLVGQAAAAFETWTGVPAPIGAMRNAVS
jgi:shikimate dehydrogenase